MKTGRWLLYCIFLIFSSTNNEVTLILFSHSIFTYSSLIGNSFNPSFAPSRAQILEN